MSDAAMSTGPTSASNAIVELRGVHVSFGEHDVLRGLDLRVERGTTLVVMGLSGTGKSVTLKTICGLQRPDSGTVQVDGVDITRGRRRDVEQARERMGYLFQAAALLGWMTAAENVALPLIESGTPARDARERALERLDQVGLRDAAERYPSQLSGGQRKRVGFARAAVRDPQLILYDEPTTGLDPVTTRSVDDLIVRGRDELGATGIVVSHDLRSAMRVADRIALLFEGRLVVDLPPDEFIQSDHALVRQFVAGDNPTEKTTESRSERSER